MKPIRVRDELSNMPNIHSLKRELHERCVHSFGLTLIYFNRDISALDSLIVRLKRELQDE